MMSSIFDDEAEGLAANAAKPDAEKMNITEEQLPKKRGRKAGSKNSSTVAKNQQVSDDECLAGATAINASMFTLACAICGTEKAWPSEEKERVMNKALSRYMSLKQIAASPELVLFGAYALYIADIAKIEEVKKGFVERFKAMTGKLSFVQKLKMKFGKENKNA